MSAASREVANGPRVTSARVTHLQARIEAEDAKAREAKAQADNFARKAKGDGPLATVWKLRAASRENVAADHRDRANRLRTRLAEAKAAEAKKRAKQAKRTVATAPNQTSGTGQRQTGQRTGQVAKAKPGAARRSTPRCTWTVSPHALSLVGVQVPCGKPATNGTFCAKHAEEASRTPCVKCGRPLGSNPDCTECRHLRDNRSTPHAIGADIDEETRTAVRRQMRAEREQRAARRRGRPSPGQRPGQAEPAKPLDSEEAIRARHPELRKITPAPLTEAQRRFFTERDSGYTGWLDQDGHRVKAGPDDWPAITNQPRQEGTTVAVTGEATTLEQTEANLTGLREQVDDLRTSIDGMSGSLSSLGLDNFSGALARIQDSLEAAGPAFDDAEQHLAHQKAIAEAASVPGEMADADFYGVG